VVDAPFRSILSRVDWSPDARVLVGPARAFRALAALPHPAGLWVMIRRPMFFSFVVGCVAAILTSGALNARLMLSVPIYWSFVPLTEIAALMLVTRTRRDVMPRTSAIDHFFMGQSAWTLFLLAVGLALSSAPAGMMWQLLTTVVLIGLVIVIAWSAYADYWFFREVFAADHRRAIRDTALVRLITWPIVVIIFAVPVLTPWALAAEISEALREIF